MTDRTLDPQHLDLSARAAAVARPRAEIVFHSDLRRVGDRSTALSGIVPVGREGPLFGDGPLNDPCISRAQLSLEWRPAAWAFAVRPDPGARRPTRTFGPDLAPCPPHAVQPGGFVAVGDRLLLRLDLFPAAPPSAGLIGQSEPMRSLRARIGRVATVERSTLIRGETGTGKELVARAVHDQSPRRQGPFCVLNCANVPAQLFESELFGHRRGAFTGADQDRDGLFQAADGGSLFLDELGELPLALQPKLLRAVQEGRVKRVGDVRERPVNVRLIAATHRDLQAAVAEGRFREDLYFRLRALRIEVPPLRDRRADVPALFAHFLRGHGTDGAVAHLWRAATAAPPPVPLDFMLRLMRHDWPGNVRELANVATEVVAENQDMPTFVEPAWPGATPAPAPAKPAAPTAPVNTPTEAGPPTAEALLAVLTAHDFKQQRAASALGVSRSTLHRWMEALALPRPRDLSAEDIDGARRADDTLRSLALRLKVSPRGLKLRMGALGLAPLAD